MEFRNIVLTMLIVLLLVMEEINSSHNGDKDVEKTKRTSEPSKAGSNPLATLILSRNEIGDVSHSSEHLKRSLSRVKRQYSYDPYYYRRYRRPYPVPIFIGGGFGFGPGIGGRGVGGRGGFGGRGFGGFGRGRGGGFGGGHGGGFGGGHGGGFGGGHGGGFGGGHGGRG